MTVDGMLDAPFGWQMSEQGDSRGSHFVDPSIIAPVGWPCRTTIVKPLMVGHEHWILLEHCVRGRAPGACHMVSVRSFVFFPQSTCRLRT